MKTRIFLLITIFLTLIQTTLFPLNFLLLLVIWEGLVSQDFLLKSFLAGVIFDLITATRLGLSSIAFLLVSLLSHLYARKFSKFHLAFLLGILTVSIVIFNFLIFKRFFTKFDLLLVLGFLVFSVVRKFYQSKELEIKLKL